MEALIALIRRRPKLFWLIGQALFNIGGFLLVVAFIGKAALHMLATGSAMAKTVAPATLAEAYPTLPTWCVPEGPIGLTIAAALVAAGILLVVTSKRSRKA